MLDLSTLNENQKKAVLETEGPVMVMAGAGSGKTRVLTHRIAHLILDLGIDPNSILAVTFTNKAAREMKERVYSLTNMNTNSMWVSTFHSFCARLLRREIEALEGYHKNFVIIDEDDALKIIRDIIKDNNFLKDIKPRYIKKLISDKKNNKDFFIKDFEMKEIFNKIYPEYEKALRADNLLDFDDLLLVTLRLFKEVPNVLLKYQQKFLYIMIDEFQDTNEIQYELMYLLSLNHRNIFIVGDQDQSIYSFRGAKVENINKFLYDFKDTLTILLEQNYRSTKPILDIANKVIKNNKNRIDKNLFTLNKSTELPVYYKAQSSYDEVMFVLDKIKELHASGYSYSDFAILYRANSLSRQFEDIFLRYNLPYVIYGGLSFFERKEIKDMIAYIRLIIDHNDDFSFKRIVNEPKRKIGPAVLDKLTDAKILNGEKSLFSSIDKASISGAGYNNLIDFKFAILELEESLFDPNKEIKDIIDDILLRTGYKNMLKDLGDEGEDRLSNINELKSVLTEADEFYEGSRREKLEAFLSDLALRTDQDNKPENEDTIKMMTFHQAKGLEFKVVFMVALEQGIFPSINSQTEAELDEERRICYVGITRAMEKLYLTSAKSRFLYGQQSTQMPSVYISEIGNDLLNVYGTLKKFDTVDSTPKKAESTIKKVELVDNSMIKLGDKINHKLFGDGVVVKDDGRIIMVAFAKPHGIKKLVKDHPSIRKI